MGRIFQPLLFLLARCTRNELIRQIEWLKAENEMLRKRVDKKRIFLDQEEKSRLMKLGQATPSTSQWADSKVQDPLVPRRFVRLRPSLNGPPLRISEPALTRLSKSSLGIAPKTADLFFAQGGLRQASVAVPLASVRRGSAASRWPSRRFVEPAARTP